MRDGPLRAGDDVNFDVGEPVALEPQCQRTHAPRRLGIDTPELAEPCDGGICERRAEGSRRREVLAAGQPSRPASANANGSATLDARGEERIPHEPIGIGGVFGQLAKPTGVGVVVERPKLTGGDDLVACGAGTGSEAKRLTIRPVAGVDGGPDEDPIFPAESAAIARAGSGGSPDDVRIGPAPVPPSAAVERNHAFRNEIPVGIAQIDYQPRNRPGRVSARYEVLDMSNFLGSKHAPALQ